jgi:hypothetical protein
MTVVAWGHDGVDEALFRVFETCSVGRRLRVLKMSTRDLKKLLKR